ncbi:MAG: amidoligase family protein [Balneolaceae bacterium]|jgi:hypothetical protein
MSFKLPPFIHNAGGEQRKVGLELEFAGVDIQRAAEIILSLYGGDLKKEHRYHYKVVDTDLGDFRVELDARILRKMASENMFGKLGFEMEKDSFGKSIEDILDRLARSVVPLEVVMPPVPINVLHKLENLREQLQENRAEGTNTSLIHAFGMHMNIESPDLTVSTLLKYLQAFLVVYPWLLETLNIDITRRFSPFVDHFTPEYVRKVLEPAYNPNCNQFIADYIKDNPTRNRPLDLMPIFGLLDEGSIKPVMEGEKNTPRPTFHYRLPNSRIDNPSWHFVDEWNAWLVVERLASDMEILHKLCRLYLVREKETVISFRNEWSKTIAILLDLDE